MIAKQKPQITAEFLNAFIINSGVENFSRYPKMKYSKSCRGNLINKQMKKDAEVTTSFFTELALISLVSRFTTSNYRLNGIVQLLRALNQIKTVEEMKPRNCCSAYATVLFSFSLACQH